MAKSVLHVALERCEVYRCDGSAEKVKITDLWKPEERYGGVREALRVTPVLGACGAAQARREA